MTATAVLLAVAGLLALGDWVAVALRRRAPEFVLKPATLAVLVAAATVAHVDADVQPWLIAGLALGLVGDVALMFSGDDEPDGWFLGGLGAFLLGHATYVIAFLQYGVGLRYGPAGVLVVVGIAGLALPSVLRGAARTGGRELAVVVAVYAALLGAMAALGVGTGVVATAVGGVLFLGSDALLARERFVGTLAGTRLPVGDIAVIVSYHAAQALILIGLTRH